MKKQTDMRFLDDGTAAFDFRIYDASCGTADHANCHQVSGAAKQRMTGRTAVDTESSPLPWRRERTANAIRGQLRPYASMLRRRKRPGLSRAVLRRSAGKLHRLDTWMREAIAKMKQRAWRAAMDYALPLGEDL